MSEPKTKREAQQRIQSLETWADTAARRASECPPDAMAGFRAEDHMNDAAEYRTNAARLRTLLPTLPE